MDGRLILGIVLGLLATWAALILLLWVLRPRGTRLAELVGVVPDILRLIRDLLADRQTPLSVRVALIGLLAWLVNPIDLIPEFIPALGPLDDVVVAVLVLRYVRHRMGDGELRKRWPGSEAGFALVVRVLREPGVSAGHPGPLCSRDRPSRYRGTVMAPADLKLEMLKSLPLFAGLDHKHLEHLGQLTDEVDLQAGRVLWHQGDVGHEAFVVVSGNLRVERNGRLLADLGRGSIIGEMAIYAEGPRMATVTVSEPSQLLVISHANFHSLMDDFPEVRLRVLDVLAQRIRLLDPDGTH